MLWAVTGLFTHCLMVIVHSGFISFAACNYYTFNVTLLCRKFFEVAASNLEFCKFWVLGFLGVCLHEKFFCPDVILWFFFSCLFSYFDNFLTSCRPMNAHHNVLFSCSQIPDSSKNTHEVFLALDKRGDFRIWQDEFESLCDVVAVVIERQRRKRRVPRSRTGEILDKITELRIVTEPVYDRMIWALTLASLLVAICEGEVCCYYLQPVILECFTNFSSFPCKITLHGNIST